MTDKYLIALQNQLPNHEIERFLTLNPSLCLAIKTPSKGYVWANHNYLTLMGFSSLNEMLHKTDTDLYTDKAVINFVKNDDEQVLDTELPIALEGDIKPARHPKLIKSMVGMAYPLQTGRTRPDAIAVLTHPKNNFIALSAEYLLLLNNDQLKTLLVRSSYPCQTSTGSIRLARMEILAFAGILKGKHAGEIADELGIKQVSVEGYLANLKNKCGVGKKSDLAHYLISQKIIEKIVV